MAQLWFKFWAKEYLSDGKVRCLSYEKRGILQTLWAFAWEEGSIPSDPEALSMMLGIPAKAMRTHCEWIANFFHPHPEDSSRWISPRLEMERLEADERGAKARESALQRWSKRNANAYANALQTQCDSPCVLHASQSQSTETTSTPTPSGRGKRRTKGEVLQAFTPWTRSVMEALVDQWHEEDGPPADRRKISISVPQWGERLEQIHAADPALTEAVMVKAACAYLQEDHLRYKAPQFFFGPEGPWRGYVQTELTRLDLSGVVNG